MHIDQQLVSAGISLQHVFADSKYAKVTLIPAGVELVQHSHNYDHQSVLAIGAVMLTVDGRSQIHRGPKILTLEAGAQHSVRALTEVVWICVHDNPDALTDQTQLDASLIQHAED